MEITLDDFLDALENAHAGMDISTFWPAHSAQIEASFSDLIAMKVFNKYKENKEKFLEGLSRVPVDCIRCHLYSSGIIGLKVARILEHKDISIEQTVDYILAALGRIQSRVFSDAFCRDGKNLLYSAKVVEGWLSKGLTPVHTNEDKRIVASLSVALESLSWAIFYDMYRYGGFVISGPYKTKYGAVLIRDGFDLKPPFWPFECKYKFIKEILVYDSDIDIECDFANHFVYKEPIVLKLKAFRIESDVGVFDLIDSLIKLTDYLEKLRKKHTEHIESLEELQIINKGAEIYSYLLKGLWDYYGEDLRPGVEIQRRIKKDGLKYWRRYDSAKRKQKESLHYRKLYDPRSDFIE